MNVVIANKKFIMTMNEDVHITEKDEEFWRCFNYAEICEDDIGAVVMLDVSLEVQMMFKM